MGGAPALRRARMAWGTAPPPPSRTKWTRLVHPSVLIGHVQSGRARTAWGTGGGGGSRDHERDAAAGRRALRGSAPQRRARGGAPEGWERLARAPRGAVQHGGVHSRLGPWNLPGREDETCPVSTGGGTRLVRLVRGRGGGPWNLPGREAALRGAVWGTGTGIESLALVSH